MHVCIALDLAAFSFAGESHFMEIKLKPGYNLQTALAKVEVAVS